MINIIPDCLENKHIDGFLLFWCYDITLHLFIYIGRYMNECWNLEVLLMKHENAWPQTKLKCTPCSLLSFLFFFFTWKLFSVRHSGAVADALVRVGILIKVLVVFA